MGKTALNQSGMSLKKRRSIIFVGDRPSLARILPNIVDLGSVFPRINIVLIRNSDSADWLRDQAAPGIYATHLPHSLLLLRRFFKSEGSRCVIFMDDESANEALRKTVKSMGIPSIDLMLGEPVDASRGRTPSDDLVVLEEREGVLDLAPLVDVLRTVLTLEFRARRPQPRTSPTRLLLRLISDPRWSRALRWRYWRIASIAEMASALGRPQTIMCLGNGPSSEDETLRDMKTDALFRVNYSWAARRILVDPDVIFTGNGDAMRRSGRAIIVTQQGDGERRVLRHKSFRGWRQIRFAQVDDLTRSLADFDWRGVRPTNGAAMVAVAAAMRPRRLVIGGIDLFRDARGAYPGDLATENTYIPKHDPERELSFILGALESFDGELVIVGDVLGQEWSRYVAERREAE